jgi:hypothetical protein
MRNFKGMFIGLRKKLSPGVVLQEEYLEFESQAIAKGMLEPVRKELAGRIKEAVENFLERKMDMPATAKDRYRNLDPLDFHLGVRGDHIDDFLNKMEIEVKFLL